MNESSKTFSRELGLPFVVVAVVALTFAALWLAERFKKPSVIIREVAKPVEVVRTVETIREVPTAKTKVVTNEVVKEVPVVLTEQQQEALAFASNFVAAPNLTDMDDALYKVDSVNVRVNLKDEVRKVVTEAALKGRCEEVLRRNGIRLDEESPYVLGLNLDGFWPSQGNELFYAANLVLFDTVTVVRRNDLRHTYAIVWVNNFLGSADRAAAPQAILSQVATNAEFFSKRLLGGQGAR